MLNEKLFKTLNVNSISSYLKDSINHGVYQSMCLLSKTSIDFNLILNRVLFDIAPSLIYVENNKGTLLNENIKLLFKRYRKSSIFSWTMLPTGLTYFKLDSNNILLVNLLSRKYNSLKFTRYLYNIFGLDKSILKNNNKIVDNFMFDNNISIIKEIKTRLKDFNLIITVDEETYKTLLAEDFFLLRWCNVLFIVFKKLGDFNNENLFLSNSKWKGFHNLDDFSNINVTYHKYIDLSILFSKTLINEFIKKEILSIIGYQWGEIDTNKLNAIIEYLGTKWSYGIISAYLDQLRSSFIMVDLPNKNPNFKLDIILELLWIDLLVNTSNQNNCTNNNPNNTLVNTTLINWWNSLLNNWWNNFNLDNNNLN